jgi:hypothetical protein
MVSLVQQRLVGDRVIRFPELGRRAPRFVADVRIGAAHHLGERVLAAIDYDFPDAARARAQGSHATLLFSDRRIFGSIKSSNIAETTLDLSLDAVTSVTDEGGFLNDAVAVGTPRGNVRFPLWGKTIAPYLRAVATLWARGRSHPAPATPSAIGLASAAIFGVGWISRPGGGLEFSVLRATVVDFPCGGGCSSRRCRDRRRFAYRSPLRGCSTRCSRR